MELLNRIHEDHDVTGNSQQVTYRHDKSEEAENPI